MHEGLLCTNEESTVWISDRSSDAMLAASRISGGSAHCKSATARTISFAGMAERETRFEREYLSDKHV